MLPGHFDIFNVFPRMRARIVAYLIVHTGDQSSTTPNYRNVEAILLQDGKEEIFKTRKFACTEAVVEYFLNLERTKKKGFLAKNCSSLIAQAFSILS